jgi:hypothetical protein
MDYFLGNLKWGFNPPGVTKVGDVERMQTKWDRDHDIKLKVPLQLGLRRD